MKFNSYTHRIKVLTLLCLAALAGEQLALAQDLGPATQHLGAAETRASTGEASLMRSIEGSVFASGGLPAEGIMVRSSAGGQALTDADGRFRFWADIPRQAKHIRINAVNPRGKQLSASQRMALPAGATGVQIGSMLLTQSSSIAPSWLPTFGGAPGSNNTIHALAVFDDGGGAALYAAGSFTATGGMTANRIAKWDGTQWAALGNGLANEVFALAVFDDGSGEALYAGGKFSSAGGEPARNIAKWNGSAWSPVGGGMDSKDVRALTVFDDGGGAALYAAGAFTMAGEVNANRVAKWNGSNWSTLGLGIQGFGSSIAVHSMTVHDDGNGAALFVAGLFSSAGGQAAGNIARWNGSNWSPLSNGACGDGICGRVNALASFDDGSGSALYATGSFSFAGGVSAKRIAKWNGSDFSALGGGLSLEGLALSVFDDGGGKTLFVGGRFGAAGGVPASGIASWDGANWEGLGQGAEVGVGPTNPEVRALSAFDDGSGARLIAGGDFTDAGGVSVSNIAHWDGQDWGELGPGLNSSIAALSMFDDGAGDALYIGGGALGAGGVEARGVARWDGSNWAPLTSGLGHSNPNSVGVSALEVFDDGGGAALFVGGTFTSAGGVVASNIAKWDGLEWSSLGSGMNNAPAAFAVFDDGSGEALFAGGSFSTAGGVPALSIAKWNGTLWSALASGTNGQILDMVVFDDGSGAALFVCGTFTTADGLAVNRIGKWDGANWSSPGSGVNNTASALIVFDDGSGAALYAGGVFSMAGGAAANRIAKWDGTNWSPLGSGMNNSIVSLSVFDDGDGAALYAGGFFTSAGGLAANHLARWDGQSWSALGAGTNDLVSSMAVFDDGGGEGLYVGGRFAVSFDSSDSFLAKWGYVDIVAPVIHSPAFAFQFDSNQNGPGEFVNFSVSASDGIDPAPALLCTPPSGSLFPPGTTLVTCTATDARGNQSISQFPVIVGNKLHEKRFCPRCACGMHDGTKLADSTFSGTKPALRAKR